MKPLKKNVVAARKMKKKSAFNNTLVEFSYAPNKKEKQDLEMFLLKQSETIEKVLKKFVKKHTNIKFDVHTQTELGKLEIGQEAEEIIRTKPWFKSTIQKVMNKHEIRERLVSASKKLLDSYDNFMRMGSGWFLIKVLGMKLKVYRYKPLRGGCFASKLPEPYNKMKGILTFPQTGDQKCFLYCVLAGLFPQKQRRNDFLQYQKLEDRINTASLTYPVRIDKIHHFERSNDLSINVYKLVKKDKDHLSKCTRVSKNCAANSHLNLLLYKGHYHLITNISAFLRYNNRHRRYQCPKCLSFRKDPKRIHICGKQTVFSFPNRGEKQYFKNVQNITRAPFVLYCDLETFSESIAREEEQAKKTKKESRHRAIAFGLYCVCTEKEFCDNQPTLYVGDDAIEKLFHELKRKLEFIHSIQKRVNYPIHMTLKDRKRHKSAEKCYLCQKDFDEPHEKFHDHNHLKKENNYLGPVCNICNLHASDLKSKIPMFLHNAGRFDLHLLIEKLHSLETGKIRVLPKTGQTFTAISLFSGNLEIRDSYNHLPSSLSELVRINKESNRVFKHTEKAFKGENLDLILRKGVFPHGYMSTKEKLNDSSLPDISKFYDPLSEKHISPEDYEHAVNVWNNFSCQTLQDYMLIYLTCDVTLLADIFESYRAFFKSKFDLDPARYVSLPSLSYDCALKYAKCKIEYMYDEETFLFVKSAIKGGVASISRRYARANNPYIDDFDRSRPLSYIMYFDCNSLYSSIMTMKLPYKNFQFVDPKTISIQDILRYTDENDCGYFIQCDLFYPKTIHDQTKDLPLAPRHFDIGKEHVSPYNQQLVDNLNIQNPTGTKLISDQYDKLKYICHIANLKFYLEQGMQLGEIHKALKFKQKAILKPYIQLCIEERAKTTSLAEKNHWKLACNSLFGKTITNLEKRVQVDFVTRENQLLNAINSPHFVSADIINSHLVQTNKTYRTRRINTPYPLGATILELSKLILYRWHYEFFVKKYGRENIELCMTDTDSLLYFIQTDDVYQDISNEINFDLSNYPEDHEVFNKKNKGKLFCMKDEVGGKPIKSFVGLRAKSYSIEFGNKTRKVTGKGIPRSKLTQITHEDMLKTLFEEKQTHVTSKHIRSYSHKLYNIQQTKLALSPFDNKRYVLQGGVHTLPIGHYKTLGGN